MSQQTNLTIVPSTSLSEIGRLNESLKPTSAEVIISCLKALMQGLWRMPNNAPFEKAVEEYVKALSGCSAGAVIAVKDKMLAGGYEFSDKGFIPIPAYFARLCADERNKLAGKIHSIHPDDIARANYNCVGHFKSSPEIEKILREQASPLPPKESSEGCG